jgi:hypothetical protein
MSISSKKVFESFKKNTSVSVEKDNKEITDKELYSRFKFFEKELNEVLDKKGGFAVVLEQHISFTRPKTNIFYVMEEIISRQSMAETIFTKHLDERFWGLIKKELKKSKSEQKSKSQLNQLFVQNIMRNKELIGNLIKNAWKVLDPQKEPNISENLLRKLFGKLFQCLGQVLKKKSDQDKSVLLEAKEFYLRSNKIYSFSGKCQELLGRNM